MPRNYKNNAISGVRSIISTKLSLKKGLLVEIISVSGREQALSGFLAAFGQHFNISTIFFTPSKGLK
ncbi:hypothetical protein SAMN06298226_0365 [Nitrosovibrio sp. Nv4]|nr:hypothetical protein SAMN06298226_0365 [Nitrosovibrio sp. Nv4]